MHIRFILLCFMLLLGGCQTTKSLYYWGHYESSIKAIQLGKDVSIDKQISELEEDIQKSRNEDLRIAPGVMAHLGYLYTLQGENKGAISAFNIEKKMFPESTAFMNRMIKKAK